MAIPGLPRSKDPYAPTKRADVEGGEDVGEMEVDEKELFDEVDEPEPEELEGELEGEGEEEVEGAEEEGAVDPSEVDFDDVGELGPEVPGDEPLEEPGLEPGLEPEEKPKPHWGPVKLPNKKDVGFQRADGFMLRMRKLESIPGRWLVQLYKDNEVIPDTGPRFMDVPAGEDPYEYAQRTADLSLDAFSQRYEQEMSPQDADRGLYADMPGTPPTSTTSVPPGEEAPEGEGGEEPGEPGFTEPSGPARGGLGGGGLGGPEGDLGEGPEPDIGETTEEGGEEEEEEGEELDLSDIELD